MAQILNLTSISTLVIIAILVVIEEKWHAFVHKIPKSPVDSKFVGHYTNSEEKSHIGLCLHFYHTHTHTHTHTHRKDKGLYSRNPDYMKVGKII